MSQWQFVGIKSSVVLVHVAVVAQWIVSHVLAVEDCGVEGHPLYCLPASTNVVRPPSLLSASSTCHNEVYCAHSGEDRQGNSSIFCSVCRPGEFAKDNLFDAEVGNSQGLNRTRWQSAILHPAAGGVVVLQLNFTQTFLLQSFSLAFVESQPTAWFVEKSDDFGVTWTNASFFAADCRRYGLLPQSYPNATRPSLSNPALPVCFENSSSSDTNLAAFFSFTAGREQGNASLSQANELIAFRSATNLRIVLEEANYNDPSTRTNQSFRYFSAHNLDVQGVCQCFGHAAGDCAPGQRCNCEHNTAGPDCSSCRAGYQDLPWRPALPGKPFECKGTSVRDNIIKVTDAFQCNQK